jgi:uncharacterized protein with NRDE domain
MANPFSKPNIQTQTYDDAYFGYNDAMSGYYDKWYRYNRKDSGKRYDDGIQAAIKQGAVILHFIEEPSL